MPSDSSDERISRRFLQVFRPATAIATQDEPDLRIFRSGVKLQEPIDSYPIAVEEEPQEPQEPPNELETLWEKAREQDSVYQMAHKAITQGDRKFPTALELKVSIAECKLDDQGNLLYRDRRWVPNSEPLRTGIIHAIHTAKALGHPGRNITYQAVAREYFWPSMSNSIRQYI